MQFPRGNLPHGSQRESRIVHCHMIEEWWW
jgi:hypothetical protein